MNFLQIKSAILCFKKPLIVFLVFGQSFIAGFGQQKPSLEECSLSGWRTADYAGSGMVEFKGGELEILMGEQLSGVSWKNVLPTKMNYEVELQAMKTDGNDFFCGLTFPINDSAASLILGGWGGGVMGISSIDGQDASANETTDYMKFDKDKWYDIKVRVTDNRIQAFLDGKSIADVNTKDKKMDIRFGVEEFLPFGIGTYQTSARFRNLRWRTIPNPTKSELAQGFDFSDLDIHCEESDMKLVNAFNGLTVSDVSVALDRYGLGNVMKMNHKIQPLWKDSKSSTHRLIGVAVTARYIPSQNPMPQFQKDSDFQNWVQENRLTTNPEPFTVLFHKGSVLVIEDRGTIHASSILKWRSQGCLGVVTSHAATNLDKISKLKIPLYFNQPGSGIRSGRTTLESVNKPVVCGGVQVRPGDIIVADSDGVAVVPRVLGMKIAEFAHNNKKATSN